MRLATFTYQGTRSFGAIVGETIVDVGAGSRYTALRDALADDTRDAVNEVVARAERIIDLQDVTLQAPIPDPGKILCIGANFARHVDETPFTKEQLITEMPVTFFRAADSLVGPGENLVRPTVAEAYDYEGELAVVIGKTAWHVQPEDAYDYVGGYAAANEGCVREWLMHTLQWTPGKNFWHSGSWGPWLVTPDEIGDITQHTITTRVNGEQRQHDTLENMIHDIPSCISYLTAWTPLHAGDVILMGTPAGVGYDQPAAHLLRAGDVVEIDVSCVGGTLRNVVIDEALDASPVGAVSEIGRV